MWCEQETGSTTNYSTSILSPSFQEKQSSYGGGRTSVFSGFRNPKPIRRQKKAYHCHELVRSTCPNWATLKCAYRACGEECQVPGVTLRGAVGNGKILWMLKNGSPHLLSNEWYLALGRINSFWTHSKNVLIFQLNIFLKESRSSFIYHLFYIW